MIALIPAGVAYMTGTYIKEMQQKWEEDWQRMMAMTPEEREAIKQANLRAAKALEEVMFPDLWAKGLC